MPQHTLPAPQSLLVWQKWSAIAAGSHFLAVLMIENRSQARLGDMLQSESCEQYCGQSKLP
jgi:hypothetical protein